MSGGMPDSVRDTNAVLWRKRQAVLVSLLIIVAGLVHALKQHPPYAPQVNTEQQAHGALKGEENAKSSSPSTAKTNEEHGGKHAEKGDEDGTEFWPAFLGVRLKITDSLLAAFTLGLLIFTGLLWRSTDKLWLAGEKQLRLLGETSAAQSRDMQASLVAAQRSADAAVAAVGSERAWISFVETTTARMTDATIDGVLVKEGILVFLRWKNRGRSPAIKAEISVTHQIIDFAGDTPVFVETWEGSEPSIPIGPDADITSGFRAIRDSEVARLYERKSVLIVYGIIRYRDVFNSEAIRITEVCLKFTFNGFEQEPGKEPVPRFEIHAVGPQNTAT